MEIDHSPKLSRVLSIPIRKTHGVLTRKGTAASRQLPPTPNFELVEMCGDDNITRERALIGDSLYDEQESNDLSDFPSHQTT